jgi:hypothetical protein
MNKVFVFVIMVPFIALLLFRAVAFYEYDTKQRYIKNLVDTMAYKVKITGTLTADEYNNEFKPGLNRLARFEDINIRLGKGTYSGGTVSSWLPYHFNERLDRGDAFMIYVESGDVSNFSRLENNGVTGEAARDLRYKAKAVCRVEKND